MFNIEWKEEAIKNWQDLKEILVLEFIKKLII